MRMRWPVAVTYVLASGLFGCGRLTLTITDGSAYEEPRQNRPGAR
jgi:hypothetical protein